jgi:hypothetical protein
VNKPELRGEIKLIQHSFCECLIEINCKRRHS